MQDLQLRWLCFQPMGLGRRPVRVDLEAARAISRNVRFWYAAPILLVAAAFLAPPELRLAAIVAGGSLSAVGVLMGFARLSKAVQATQEPAPPGLAYCSELNPFIAYAWIVSGAVAAAVPITLLLPPQF